MAWRDSLLDASFKGANFFITEHTVTGGINATENSQSDFENNAEAKGIEKTDKKILSEGEGVSRDPRKDIAIVEHISGSVVTASVKKRKFTISAFLIGENYQIKRDKLLSLLREDTAGELVHPYLGVLNVKALDWSATEGVLNGGTVNFNIIFCEEADKIERQKKENEKTLIPEALLEIKKEELIYNINKKTAKIVATKKQIEVAKDWLKKNIVDDRLDDLRNFNSMLEFLDDYYDVFKNIDSIPTMLNVAGDIFYNTFLSPYHKIKALIRAISIAISPTADYKTKQHVCEIRDSVIKAIDAVSVITSEQDIYRNMQDIKAGFIDVMFSVPAQTVIERHVHRESTWLNLLFRKSGSILNEAEFRNLNSQQANPLFYKNRIFYSEG